MTGPPPSLPLQEVLVADFSRILAGPLCTQMLADLGARVIKIEEARGGDETRRWGPPFASGISTYFLAVNRNKESVALDLKREEGRLIASRLMARADVVVDNFLPAQRQTLGIHPPASAVHCSITGYDSDSPSAARPGFDLLAQAGCGLMSITGHAEGEPVKVGVALSDVLTAHYASASIAAALYDRARTGRGARIEVSLFSASLASLINVAQAALITGEEAGRYGNAHPSIVPYQLFHASDRPFVVGAGTDRQFQSLCRALQREDWLTNPAFSTNEQRVINRQLLIDALNSILITAPAHHWLDLFREHGVPAELVRGVKEALDSEEGSTQRESVEHAQLGRYQAVRSPVRWSGARLSTRSAPPSLGQHSAALLAELGFDAGDIARFEELGVIATPHRSTV